MYRILQTGLCIIFHAAVVAQPVSDSSVRVSALHAIIREYDQQLGNQSHVYNGPVYYNRFAAATLKGHPYFGEDDWENGYIFYDGQRYEGLTLRYNLFLDRVIVQHPAGPEIELISEKIKHFSIGDQVFDRLELPTPGFYERIYQGQVRVYARHYKTMQEKPGNTIMITEFLTKRKLYIFKDGNYFPVSSKASALNVFRDHKSELKKVLRNQDIIFSNDKKYALFKMAEYIDNISRQP